MKLSLRGEYALRALVALGDSYEGEVVSMQTVSEQQEIPKRFLEQIFNELRGGGFVESKRGIAGGYRLARPKEEITLAEVIRHVEGNLVPMSDLGAGQGRVEARARGTHRAIKAVMLEVREAVVEILGSVTLGDLEARARQLQLEPSVPDYTI